MPKLSFSVVVVDECLSLAQQIGQEMAGRCADVKVFSNLQEAARLIEAGGVSMLLVSLTLPGYQKLLRVATVCGLEISLLYRSKSQTSIEDCSGLPALPENQAACAIPDGVQTEYSYLDPEPTSSDVGRVYVCRTNFGSMKFGCHLLQSVGTWWELQSNQAPVHERYRKLLNRVRDGIIEVGPDNKVRWANKAFQELLGREDIVGISVVELVDPVDLPSLRAIDIQMRNGIIIPLNLRLASGTVVEVDYTPRFTVEGKFMGTISLVRASSVSSVEFEASRNLGSLYSLALALSKSFGMNEIIATICDAVRQMCGQVSVGVKVDGHELVIERSPEVLIGPDLLDTITSFCGRLKSHQVIRVIRDVDRDPDPAASILKSHGFVGLACVPLNAGQECIGHIWTLASDATALSREKNSFLISVGVQAGMALQNALYVQARLDEQANRRHFYRDALQAITSGKLVFCEHNELDEYWESCGEDLGTLPLAVYADVSKARHLAETCMDINPSLAERRFDMVTCVSEAATNVVKYGPPGMMRVKANENGLRVRLDDVGPGIAFANLPKAVLLAGYSKGSLPSLGLGYSVVLELCDCIHLATDSHGTSLILEMLQSKADPLDAFVGFANVELAS